MVSVSNHCKTCSNHHKDGVSLYNFIYTLQDSFDRSNVNNIRNKMEKMNTYIQRHKETVEHSWAHNEERRRGEFDTHKTH